MFTSHPVTTGPIISLDEQKDLKARLQKHNAGEVSHTAKFRPWRIKIAIAFVKKPKAISFERYLKSHSGRAFAKRHF